MKKIILFTVVLIGCIITVLSIYKARSTEFEVTDFDGESLICVDGESGGFLVKEKKYVYKGKDLMLLEVENQTENAYTILLKTYYTLTDGREISIVKWFNDFPKGYKNYFLFKPGLKFEDFRCELITSESTGYAVAEQVVFDTRITIEAWPFSRDFYGRELSEQSAGIFAGLDYELRTGDGIKCDYKADVLIFGSDGELYTVVESLERNFASGKHTSNLTLLLPGEVPWKNFSLPSELKGDVRAVVAVKSVSISEADE